MITPLWSQGLVRLHEGWEVVHDRLLSPLAFPEEGSPLEFPENNYLDKEGKRSSQCKVGTYRLRIASLKSDEMWGLIVPEIFSAYNLFINGVRIGEMGAPSSSPGSYRARVQPEAYFFPGREGTEILLQVANFHVIGDKIRQVPLLGKADEVQRYLLGKWGVELFLIVFLFFIGIALLVLPETYKPRGSRFLGLFFLTLAIRMGFTGWRLFLQVIPFLDFELVSDLGYVTASLAALFFVAAMLVRFRDIVDFHLTHVVLTINVLGFFSVLVFPTPNFEPYSLMFDLGLGLAIAWSLLLPLGLLLAKKPFEPVFWLSYSALPLAALLDYVIYGGLVRDEWFFLWGVFFFALGQLVHLAYSNARHEKKQIELFLELSETTERRAEFVSLFQHHLRTPIHTLLSFLERRSFLPSDTMIARSLTRSLKELNLELEKLFKEKN